MIGVDTNPTKVEMITSDRSHVVEEGLPELIAAGVQSGCLRATTRAADAVAASDVSMICVGTPAGPTAAST